MKVLLVALNAKYYHSNLALRCLAAYCPQYAANITRLEFTINNSEDTVLKAIFKEKPDVLCFSCYIWNISMTLSLVGSLKKILPRLVVVLGGPEVSHNAEAILKGHPVDIVVCGEGERPFSGLMDYYISGRGALETIPGVIHLGEGGRVVCAGSAPPVELDTLPFVYAGGLAGLENKIIYYETSRGCPFHCAYCMSGGAGGARFLSAGRFRAELAFFLSQRVRQVKLVDRTFNCNKEHAMGVWRFLAEHDNGETNFHFELAGDLIDDDMLALFSGLRPGLFQFEIGVQSTNAATLASVGRRQNLEKLFRNVGKIAGFGNIHLHLDLIAGLPKEDMESFAVSFNDVYRARPNQLQLGFLKLLHGSGLRRRAGEHGIVYRENPPYEVLYTDVLPYEDIIRIKSIEEMLEMYYNSNMCGFTLKYAVPLFPSPFCFYGGLAGHFETNGYAGIAHGKKKLYDIMRGFLLESLPGEAPIISELLLFDMFVYDRVLGEQAAHLPGWASLLPTDGEKRGMRRAARAFPGNEDGALNRKLHIQKFGYDILAWADRPEGGVIKRENFALFEYTAGKCSYIYARV